MHAVSVAPGRTDVDRLAAEEASLTGPIGPTIQSTLQWTWFTGPGASGELLSLWILSETCECLVRGCWEGNSKAGFDAVWQDDSARAK